MKTTRSPTLEQSRRAIRITAVPRLDHPNSGLQAIHFAAHYDDEVWALPAPGHYIGEYKRVEFSVLDTDVVKAFVPARVIRALYLIGLFAKILFTRKRLFFVHSFIFAIPLWLLRQRYCIFIHGSDRRFLNTGWGRFVSRRAAATYGVGFGTRDDEVNVQEVPNIFVPANADQNAEAKYDLLFVLRNAPVKNPYYPVELACSLGEKLGLRIAVVGVATEDIPSEYREQLAQLQGCGVQLTYAGRQSYEEVVRWMRESRILMIPSLSEGLPKALLEGMSQGLHVIINAPLSFADEIMGRVERVDVYDWDAVGRAIGKFRTCGRSRDNIEFSRDYLIHSEQALFEIYDRHYKIATA